MHEFLSYVRASIRTCLSAASVSQRVRASLRPSLDDMGAAAIPKTGKPPPRTERFRSADISAMPPNSIAISDIREPLVSLEEI
jgi:hypothetical protein